MEKLRLAIDSDQGRKFDPIVGAELGRRFGQCNQVTPVGVSGSTWLVQSAFGRFVLKRFNNDRPMDLYVPLFGELHQEVIGPRLLDTIKTQEEWFAVFEFLSGDLPLQNSKSWQCLWPQAIALLQRLRAIRNLPTFDLSSHWTHILGSYDFHDAPAELLKHRLQTSLVPEPFGLAHGDFSPQNFMPTPRGLMLIDWDSAGRAPISFDAGWLLLLGELGLTPLRTPSQLMTAMQPLGLESSALKWSLRLGLLRLFWRTRTLAIDPRGRIATITRLRQLICRELENPD